MTWEEFVRRVDAQLAERGTPRSTEVEAIDWSAAAFGGPTPDVYVNVIDARLVITED